MKRTTYIGCGFLLLTPLYVLIALIIASSVSGAMNDKVEIDLSAVKTTKLEPVSELVLGCAADDSLLDNRYRYRNVLVYISFTNNPQKCKAVYPSNVMTVEQNGGKLVVRLSDNARPLFMQEKLTLTDKRDKWNQLTGGYAVNTAGSERVDKDSIKLCLVLDSSLRSVFVRNHYAFTALNARLKSLIVTVIESSPDIKLKSCDIDNLWLNNFSRYQNSVFLSGTVKTFNAVFDSSKGKKSGDETVKQTLASMFLTNDYAKIDNAVLSGDGNATLDFTGINNLKVVPRGSLSVTCNGIKDATVLK